MVEDKKLTCNHPAKLLQFSKMFINDNGKSGGQKIEVLLECKCSATLFIRQERGNFPKQYHVKTSTISYFSKGKSENGAKTMVIP